MSTNEFASSGAALHRLSTFMRIAVVITGALAEIALIWLWASPTAVSTILAPRLGLGLAPVALDGWTRLAGFSIAMVPMAVLLYLLFQVYKLFAGYRRGQIFTNEPPFRLGRIGLAMLILAALRPVTAALLGVILTASNPPGQRILSIGIAIEDVMIAVFGGLILAIGHVMAEGKRLADDHRQII